MSKEITVDINLKFTVKETGMFPPYEGLCLITATGADGSDWTGKLKYDDGRSPEDTIKTICRMDSFSTTLPNLAVAALPVPEPEPKSDAYAQARSDLMDKKVGELRKIIADQNMQITTGGKKKGDVIDEIIAELKKRDGVPEE